MLIHTCLLRFDRARSPRGSRFLLPLAEGFFQRGFRLLERDTSATAIDLLAGKTLGRHFNVRRQQHHVSLADGLGAQRVACAHRTLGFDLQVIAQALGRLLQGFGGHEGMRHARWTRRDRDNFGRAGRRRSLDHRVSSGVHLGLFHAPAQYPLYILQGLGRGALKHAFTDKALHVQRRTAHHQYPLGFIDHRCR